MASKFLDDLFGNLKLKGAKTVPITSSVTPYLSTNPTSVESSINKFSTNYSIVYTYEAAFEVEYETEYIAPIDGYDAFDNMESQGFHEFMKFCRVEVASAMYSDLKSTLNSIVDTTKDLPKHKGDEIRFLVYKALSQIE